MDAMMDSGIKNEFILFPSSIKYPVSSIWLILAMS